jgi:ribosomal-protein-alanine N-acetyltransferase
MINIRRAGPADLPSILRIETKSFGHDAWDRAMFLYYFARPARSVFFVACVDRSVAGYALACHTATRAEIHSIAVAPSHRGKGIAVALMRRVIATLARRGFSTVSLNVRLENKAAIGLYRKYGFQRVRRVNDYYEDGAPSWRMRRGVIS